MIVYKISNLFYGTSYIGQTTKSIQERWRQHLSKAAHGSKYILHCAIRKYGPDAFSIEVLHEGLSKEEADFVEAFYISALITRAPMGYNMTDGGEGQAGVKFSSEACKRMSLARIGKDNHQKGLKRSEESRERMRIAQAKNTLIAGFSGKKHSEEAKKKVSEARLRRLGKLRKNTPEEKLAANRAAVAKYAAKKRSIL